MNKSKIVGAIEEIFTKLRVSNLYFYFLMCLFAFLFIYLRTNRFTGGDSEQWEREIYNGIWLRKRQMLSFFLMQLSYQVLHFLLNWNSFLAIQFYSCVCGIIALWIIYNFFKDNSYPILSFLIVFTAGFTAVFYGHIETYALPIMSLLLFLLALKKYLSNVWQITSVILTYSLFIFSHLIALFIAPVVLLLIINDLCARGITKSRIKQIALATLPLLVFIYLVFHLNIGGGELVGVHYLNIFKPNPEHRFLWFSRAHLNTILYFLWINGGISFPVAIFCLLRARREILSKYLLFILGGFSIFLCFWHPDAGRLDWDLFSFPAVVSIMIVAIYLHSLFNKYLLNFILGIIVILINSCILFPRVISWAELDRRGYGQLMITRQNDEIQVLLDDRLFLADGVHYVSQGEHKITIRQMSRKPYEIKIHIKKGERKQLKLETPPE
ncbi:MAG: hypothetical protein N2246_01290 [Candidatus Sumerlaeia bacterium]|nr:hypothetical protein [Candidatus Sumerlaeia bacterium]